MQQLAAGRIRLRVEGAYLLVMEARAGREFKRARFPLGDVTALLLPHFEAQLSGADPSKLQGLFDDFIRRALPDGNDKH